MAVWGANSVEWFLSNLGTVFARGLAVGIYDTSDDNTCKYILDHSKANVIVVDGNDKAERVWKMKHQLPHLRAIVQYGGNLIFNQSEH